MKRNQVGKITAPCLPLVCILIIAQLYCVLVGAWTCSGTTVTAPFTLSSGTSTATNCVIQATITLTNDAELHVYTSTTNSAGRIRSVGPNTKVLITSTTIGGDVEIQQGEVNITDSTVTGFGRIMGTSVSASAETTSLLGVLNTVFQDTSSVVDQITANHVGLATKGHRWSISRCTFIGRGGIRIDTLRMGLMIFTENDFSQLVRTPGSITTAITVVNAGLTYLTSFTFGTIWNISGNIATLNPLSPMHPIDFAGAGGIALINIGSMALPTGSVFVGVVIIAINQNVNFIQIVSGGNAWRTPTVALSIPTFNNNRAAPIINAPSSLSVFDFGTMSFSGGTTFSVAFNNFNVLHTNALDTSGVVSLYAHPGQSSTTASSISATSNVFTVGTAGGVDAAFVHYKSRGSSNYHSVGGTYVGNTHTATTVNGRATFMLVDGTSTFVKKTQSILSLACALYSQSAAALIATSGSTELVLSDSGKIIVGGASVEYHPLTGTAKMSIVRAPKMTINHVSSTVSIYSNSINLNSPAAPSDMFSLSGGTQLLAGLLEFKDNVVSGCVASTQRVMSGIYSGTGNANGCGNRICGNRLQTLRKETSGWVWSWCPTDTESISISPSQTTPFTVTPLLNRTRTKTSTPTPISPTQSMLPLLTATKERTSTLQQPHLVTPTLYHYTATPLSTPSASASRTTSTTSSVRPLLLPPPPPSTDGDDGTTATGTVVATAGTIVFGGSGLVADSASSIQITAIFTVMVCKTNGGSTTTARLFLTPLRVADTPSADLIGSCIILISVFALYLIIDAIVFTCIRRCEPKLGTRYITPEGEEAPHTFSSAAEVTARRIFRAKMFLYYPRLPVLVATLLFPGIVLESCSLMYGSLADEAANWERFLGALGFVAALSLVTYEHVVAIFAQEQVRSHALRTLPVITSLVEATSDTEDDDESAAMTKSIVHNQQPHVRRHTKAALSTTRQRYAPSVVDNSGTTSSGRGSLLRPCDGGSVICNARSDSNVSCQLPATWSNSMTLIEFVSTVNVNGQEAVIKPPNTTKNTHVLNLSALSRSSLSHQQLASNSLSAYNKQHVVAMSPGINLGLCAPGESGEISHHHVGVAHLFVLDNSHWSMESLAETPGVAGPNREENAEKCVNGSDDFEEQQRTRDTKNHDEENDYDIKSRDLVGSGEIPLEGNFSVVGTPTQDNWSEAMKGVGEAFSDGGEFFDYDTNDAADEHAPIVLAFRAMSHPQEAILDPKTAPWFVEYSEQERAMQPVILQKTLLAVGHWNTFVYRSTYCVVVAFRPGKMVWVAAHNLWRMLLIGIIGAISPSDADDCKYVQGTIVAICFIHGLLIYITRVFRIPVLNFLQGSQSILLGLLACSPFVSESNTQSVFANTLIALSLTTVLMSLLAMILEVRIQKKQEELRKEAWVSKFRAEEMEGLSQD